MWDRLCLIFPFYFNLQHRADFHGSEEMDFSYENIGPDGAGILSGILRRPTVSELLKRLKLK